MQNINTPPELIAFATARGMTPFSNNGLRERLRRDPTAPKILVFGPRKHALRKAEFMAWLEGVLAA